MVEILIEYRSVLTAVLVALISILGAFALQRYLVIRNAVHTYKSSFSDCVSAIANNSFALDTFARDFEKHMTAVDSIRHILPKRHQKKLQKAWDDYCGKNTVLGLEPEEYIQAYNAMLYSTNKEMFNEFKVRFNVLHSCLDGFL